MNHAQILKRSWNILWSYKTLWVFGILLAITAGGSNGGNGGNNNGVQWQQPAPRQIQWPAELSRAGEEVAQITKPLDEFFRTGVPQETVALLIGIAITLVCLGVVVGIAFTVLRYVSQTALIRMVDRYEATGEKAGWRAGFRMGWSRSALRIFLIDLLVFLPAVLVFFAALVVAAAPLLISLISGGAAVIGGAIMTIGLEMLVIFAFIAAMIVLGMAVEIIRRECVLNGGGVPDSIRAGFAAFRANGKDVFILWLLLVAVTIGIGILMIPVALLLIGLGLVIGGGAGAVVYLLLQSGSQLTALIAAAAAGGFLFVFLLALPILWVQGLRETYMSTAWTLAYRALPLRSLEGAINPQSPS